MALVIQREFIAENSYKAVATNNCKRLRTVVVDDSPTFLEVICALLELEENIDVLAKLHARREQWTQAFRALLAATNIRRAGGILRTGKGGMGYFPAEESRVMHVLAAPAL